MLHVTCDMCYVTHDMWHVTLDMWHTKCDKWGAWTFSQNFSLSAFRVWKLWCFEDLEERADLINDKGVCRRALATPGLLKMIERHIWYIFGAVQKVFYSNLMSLPTSVTNLKDKGKKKKNPVEKKILEPFRDIIRKRPVDRLNKLQLINTNLFITKV